MAPKTERYLERPPDAVPDRTQEEVLAERERNANLYKSMKVIREGFDRDRQARLHEMQTVKGGVIQVGTKEDWAIAAARSAREREGRVNKNRQEATDFQGLILSLDFLMDRLRPGLRLVPKFGLEHPVPNHAQLAQKYLPGEIARAERGVDDAAAELRASFELKQGIEASRARLAAAQERVATLKLIAQQEGVTLEQPNQPLRQTREQPVSSREQAPGLTWKRGPDGNMPFPEFKEMPSGTVVRMQSETGSEYTLVARPVQGDYRWQVSRQGAPLFNGEAVFIMPYEDPQTKRKGVQFFTQSGGIIPHPGIVEVRASPPSAGKQTAPKTRLGFQ